MAVAIIIATSLVYAPVRHFGFVNFDDGEFVVENPNVASGVSLANLSWAFRNAYAGTGGPLTWMSHMLDVQLFGLNSGRHHLTSLALHLANSVLLLVFLARATGSAGRSAAVAGLFALHPLHVESVAWIAQRKDVLSTTFWFMTLLAYSGYVRRPSVVRYGLVFLLLTLGLLAKPMLVTVPLVLLLLDIWPFKRLAGPPNRWRNFQRLLIEKVPLAVVAVGALVLTFLSQQESGAISALASIPLSLRLGNASVSLVAYLGQVLWPVHLAAFYPYRETISLLTVAGCLAVLSGISALVVVARRKPFAPIGWLWYLVTLLPVLGFVQVGSHAMADRFTYVPLIGVFILIVWGASDLLERLGLSPRARAAIAIGVISACAVVAGRQVHVWRDSQTLWEHAIAVTTDNYRAHANLGVVLAERGDTRSAISHYTESVRINPNQAQAQNNLGLALAATRAFDAAIAHYEAALKIDPAYANAHHNLSAALAEVRRFDEAAAHSRDAIRLRPDYAEAHLVLAMTLGSSGQIDEAIAEALTALRLRPDVARWHYITATLYLERGQRAEAIARLETARHLDPANEEVRRALAELRR